jgi:hypothetical protein
MLENKFLLCRRAKLNLEIQNLTSLGRPNFNSVFQVQQDSLEDSYSQSKGNEMAILTALSDSTRKAVMLTKLGTEEMERNIWKTRVAPGNMKCLLKFC